MNSVNRSRGGIVRGMSAMLALACATGSAWSVTKTWTGAANTNWGNANNWSPVGVPGAADDVVIGAGGPGVNLDVNTTVQSMQLARPLLSNNRALVISGGDLTLSGGLITLVGDSAQIGFNGVSQSLSGNGIIQSAADSEDVLVGSGSLTVGAGITIRSTTGRFFLSAAANASLRILGTVEPQNGSTLFFVGAGQLLNYDPAALTLTGGTWFCNGGNISLALSQPFTGIGPNTTLKFGGGTFTGIGNLVVNAGTLEALNGAEIGSTPASGVFTNAGSLILGTGSRFSVGAPAGGTGRFRQIASGVLDLTFSPSLPAGTQAVVTCTASELAGTVRARVTGLLPPDCGATFTLVNSGNGTRTGTFSTTQYDAQGQPTATDYLNTSARLRIDGVCPPVIPCDDIDYNNDGVSPDLQDIIKFLEVYAGGQC